MNEKNNTSSIGSGNGSLRKPNFTYGLRDFLWGAFLAFRLGTSTLEQTLTQEQQLQLTQEQQLQSLILPSGLLPELRRIMPATT